MVKNIKEKEARKTYPFSLSKKQQRRLLSWFYKEKQEILDQFATLKDAVKIGEDGKQFVFVPGTRKDRVLLVAHADTVWDDDGIQIKIEDGILSSSTPNKGIGADDRAGIAMLWELRNSGHSLLIPNDEEVGCVGANHLMSLPEWKTKINETHQFAIEMDRMNDNDLAFYHVGSSAFKDFCEQNFDDYKRTHGSYTDICILCDPMCGVNISVGYYGQHGSDEKLHLDEWARTLYFVDKLLKKDKLERFTYEKQSYSHGYTPSKERWLPIQEWNKNNRPARGEYESFDQYVRDRDIIRDSTPSINLSGIADDIVVCPSCDGTSHITEITANNELCPFMCGYSFASEGQVEHQK